MTKQEFRKLWVKALRSGEYEQTECSLRDNIGYCCLGVACDLYNNHFPNDLLEIYVDEDRGQVYVYDNCATYLPEKVRIALGLQTIEGRMRNYNLIEINSLSLMNDRGATFNDIADMIESSPDGLFEKE